MKPEVSVIIPSLGRETVLAGTIRELLTQDLTNWECIVVLQGERTSDRPVDEIAETDGRIRIFILQEPNASLARNVGLVEARADIVLFLDDDVRFRDAGFLRAHVRHYDVASASGVAGQIVAPEGEVRFRRHARSQRTDTGWLYTPANFAFPLKTRSGVSANLSVRRAWAIEAGGMDARFEKGAHREESDFCIRYTERFGLLDFDPAAGLVHLQVDSGGCRTWGHNAGVHPPHHVQGEWYFILKGLTRGYIRARHLPDHLLLLMLR
jgi:glycosyltransferase involved in cell wall biosynthesis